MSILSPAPATPPATPVPQAPLAAAPKPVTSSTSPAQAPVPTASAPAPASAAATLTQQVASALQQLVSQAAPSQTPHDTARATRPAATEATEPLSNQTPVSTGQPQQASSAVPVYGTPEAFDRDATRLVDQFRNTYNEQLGQARQLQTQVRDVVEQFIVLVAKDDDLRQVFHADDLSDDQKAVFHDKIVTIERETGLTWGSDADLTPLGKANLNLRRFTSGMML